MDKGNLQIESISQLHELFGVSNTKHPLISIVSQKDIGKKVINNGYLNLFSISFQNNISTAASNYGRKSYDFNESLVSFSEPNNINATDFSDITLNSSNWILFFHFDMIRNTTLEHKIDVFKFFFYQKDEALHLSSSEMNILNNCVNLISNELNERIDSHSQIVIVSTLELLLNLCSRFYDRQFNTRGVHNIATVKLINSFLKEYYQNNLLSKEGVPSPDLFAKKSKISVNYLNDLLKKETGKTTKEYIHNFIIDKAKILLLNNNNTIEELANSLGFKFVNYFNHLFKINTGISPEEYKSLH